MADQMTSHRFAPFGGLADQLLQHAKDNSGDGSHDLSHLQRVWKNACSIREGEGGDAEILLAAVLLHDCVPVEKNSPLRNQASRLSAEKAGSLLRSQGWDGARIAAVTHAIEAHSFSAGIAPMTLEAKILQDADRLDAIGAIGVARCFYTAGRMGSGLYDSEDPAARQRPYDDKRFAIDHFPAKLFTLSSGFQTETGARMAGERHRRLQQFFDDFLDEI